MESIIFFFEFQLFVNFVFFKLLKTVVDKQFYLNKLPMAATKAWFFVINLSLKATFVSFILLKLNFLMFLTAPVNLNLVLMKLNSNAIIFFLANLYIFSNKQNEREVQGANLAILPAPQIPANNAEKHQVQCVWLANIHQETGQDCWFEEAGHFKRAGFWGLSQRKRG